MFYDAMTAFAVVWLLVCSLLSDHSSVAQFTSSPGNSHNGASTYSTPYSIDWFQTYSTSYSVNFNDYDSNYYGNDLVWGSTEFNSQTGIGSVSISHSDVNQFTTVTTNSVDQNDTLHIFSTSYSVEWFESYYSGLSTDTNTHSTNPIRSTTTLTSELTPVLSPTSDLPLFSSEHSSTKISEITTPMTVAPTSTFICPDDTSTSTSTKRTQTWLPKYTRKTQCATTLTIYRTRTVTVGYVVEGTSVQVSYAVAISPSSTQGIEMTSSAALTTTTPITTPTNRQTTTQKRTTTTSSSVVTVAVSASAGGAAVGAAISLSIIGIKACIKKSTSVAVNVTSGPPKNLIGQYQAKRSLSGVDFGVSDHPPPRTKGLPFV